MKKVFFLFIVLNCIFISTQANSSDSLSVGSNDSITTETNLPGLGLDGLPSAQTYKLLLDDGVTTLGLYYYSGKVYITGINTTATEVHIPTSVTIDGVEMNVYSFGYNYNAMDWNGAPKLSKLHLNAIQRISPDFSKSNITDLYIYNSCSISSSNVSNIYLHIPYSIKRSNYSSYGFKRVLVGDEQIEYPESSNSDWVIAGEEKGDYFGILLNNNRYCIVEIFTSKDSISLPVNTPASDGMQTINQLGYESYNSGALCKNSQNLNTITIPATYNYMNVNWEYNPIVNLYMNGDVPTTNWPMISNMAVYVPQLYYSNYKNSTQWNSAQILPNGWDFEWMTVEVGRKGEFAQTYIEMTDADWSAGVYVKISGELDATDLGNIKKLTNLIKLDLSEAEFKELPSSFLNNKSSLIEVVLPSSLKSISSSAFIGCTRIEKVLASGVTDLKSWAFNGCSKLVDFDISKVTSISENAFSGCSSFNPTKLSPGLKTIGSSAFSYSGITEVSLPDSISIINSSVFNGCKQLQKVTLPQSITSIHESAFSGCTNLTEIVLPEGLRSIGNSVFANCSKLSDITLPSTLESIGSHLFSGCESLATVKCKAIVPPTANYDFTYNVDMNHCTLYIAPFVIDAYRAALNWNAFYIMKPLTEPVKNIYVNRPIALDLLSEDNAVLQENPNITLNYKKVAIGYYVGQLSASGEGTLSAGVFSINHIFGLRDVTRGSSVKDTRTTLVNNAENMRADSVVCTIEFEKNYWHFISFQYDVKMEDILGVDNTDFVIRKYNGVNRASGDGIVSNWENVAADGILEAGKGYIIQAANNTTNENGSRNPAVVRFPSRNTVTKNNLFASNNIIVPLEEYPAEFAHNRSWNLVGNPYPCYYDMHYLMNNFTTPIVLWRGTSYQAYSPIDDDIILRPNEAFFVQRPLDAAEMALGADGRIHYDKADDSDANPGSKAPMLRTEEAMGNRSVFNFNIAGCGSDDRARIVMNEKAAIEYEINCDASKFFAEEPNSVEFFVNGDVRYDICERPFADGKAVLGARFAKDGDYTISLSGRSIAGWNVILKDTETGVVVDLTENSYQFTAKAGFNHSRFTLTFKAPESTSIENIISAEDEAEVSIINTAGVTVFEGNLDSFKANAKSGVYIVVSSEKSYKIVIN